MTTASAGHWDCAQYRRLYHKWQVSVGEERMNAHLELSEHITNCPSCAARWAADKLLAEKARVHDEVEQS